MMFGVDITGRPAMLFVGYGLARAAVHSAKYPAVVRLYRERRIGTHTYRRELATPAQINAACRIQESDGAWADEDLHWLDLPCSGGDCEGGYGDDGSLGVRCYRHDNLRDILERLVQLRSRDTCDLCGRRAALTPATEGATDGPAICSTCHTKRDDAARDDLETRQARCWR